MIPTTSIKSIIFYPMGDDDIKDTAVTTIVQPTINENGLPFPGGPNDLYMGTTVSRFICQTCLNEKAKCPGHPGSYDLNYPILSPLFVQELNKWLNLICFNCGLDILSDEEYEILAKKYPRKELFSAAVDAAKKLHNKTKNKAKMEVRCSKCDYPHPKIVYKISNPYILIIEFGSIEPQRVYPKKIKEILDRITDETVIKFGYTPYTHPKKYVLSKIRVSPNSIRPGVTIPGSKSSIENDITLYLQNIIKKNLDIPSSFPQMTTDIERAIRNLNVAVHEMIKGPAENQPSNKKLTAIGQRISAKHGRVRSNLMGKRARRCGRAPITCDPELKPSEIGVPISIARNIEIKMVVGEYNFNEALIYFRNGTHKYPGCTQIKKKSTGRKHRIDGNKSIQLEVGDILYRNIIDGDLINVNRNPSLKKSNITSMYVRIKTEAPTLRLNVTSCNLYAADFDGDEINILIFGSASCVAESSILSSVEDRFISQQHGQPEVGEAQDSVIGTAKLTKSTTKMNKYHAMRMFSRTNIVPDFSENKVYSGRDIMTKYFNSRKYHINYKRTSNFYNKFQRKFRDYDEGDIRVEIKNGEHLTGVLDKSSLSETAQGSIFQIIENKYGAHEAIEASFAIQQLAINYNKTCTCSISFGDVLLNDDSQREIDEINDELIHDSINYSLNLENGEIIPPLGRTIEEYFESLQKNALDSGDKYWSPILRSIDVEKNGLYNLLVHGSGGKFVNIRSMSSSVGQLSMDGQRIPMQMVNRVLPFYCMNSDDPRARGYVVNSYLTGMTISECLMHSMESRLTLIKRSNSTATAGAQSRNGIKSLESHIINNHRSLEKNGKIIHSLYGFDGTDPKYTYGVFLPTMSADLTIDELKKRYKGEELKHILEDREYFIKLKLQNEELTNEIYTNIIYSPINMHNILEDTINNNIAVGTLSTNIEERLQELFTDIEYNYYNEIQKEQKTPVHALIKSNTKLIKIMLRSYINSYELKKRGITDNLLFILCKEIAVAHEKALASYGSAAGIIAVLIISEPLTQSIISSHHAAGAGGAKRESSDRTGEIINAKDTDKMEVPHIHIELLDEWANDEVRAQDVAFDLEMIKLKNFIRYHQIINGKLGETSKSSLASENKLIQDFIKYNPDYRPPSNLYDMCVRIVLNKNLIIEKKIKIEDIQKKIIHDYPNLYVIYSPLNSENLFLRIYFSDPKKLAREQRDKYIHETIDELYELILRGIDGIKYCDVNSRNLHVLDNDGSIKQTKRYYLFAEGTNLRYVLLHPAVDPNKTHTNSILEMARLFGIEVARKKIIYELATLIEGGKPISHKHYDVYASEMCFTGSVTSMNRFGSKSRGTSVLQRISEAEVIGNITSAAVLGKKAKITDISSPLILGQGPRVGTTYNEIAFNEKFINENIKSQMSVLEEI